MRTVPSVPCATSAVRLAATTGMALVLALAAPWASAQASPEGGPDAEWTDVDGIAFRARLLGCDDYHAFLSKDGRDHRLPLGLLSEASRAQVCRMLNPPPPWAKDAARHLKTAAAAPAAPPPATPRHTGTAGTITAPALVSVASLTNQGSLARDRHGMPLYGFHTARRIVRTTAYTSLESDHLIYGDRSAFGSRLQYTGARRSAAADWSVYPVGTVFRIKGLPQLHVVDDYGSALVGTGTIDIYQPDWGMMHQWGRRNVEITIVRWGSLTRSAEILSRRTGSRHCHRMFDAILRQRPDLAYLARQ